MNEDKTTYEYACISIALGSVNSVTPNNPATKTALEAGKEGGLIAAINKMAEYDYKLLEGTSLVLECALDGSFAAVFMYRVK